MTLLALGEGGFFLFLITRKIFRSGLLFEYQATNIPEEVKSGFEESANNKFASVCEQINKAGAVMMVHWTGIPQRLGALLR